MDLDSKSPNNKFVENRLENWVLVNQTSLRMDSDVERMKKKGFVLEKNRHRQDPRRSVLIYCS